MSSNENLTYCFQDNMNPSTIRYLVSNSWLNFVTNITSIAVLLPQGERGAVEF